MARTDEPIHYFAAATAVVSRYVWAPNQWLTGPRETPWMPAMHVKPRRFGFVTMSDTV